jgi:hypothetical protein
MLPLYALLAGLGVVLSEVLPAGWSRGVPGVGTAARPAGIPGAPAFGALYCLIFDNPDTARAGGVLRRGKARLQGYYGALDGLFSTLAVLSRASNSCVGLSGM